MRILALREATGHITPESLASIPHIRDLAEIIHMFDFAPASGTISEEASPKPRVQRRPDPSSPIVPYPYDRFPAPGHPRAASLPPRCSDSTIPCGQERLLSRLPSHGRQSTIPPRKFPHRKGKRSRNKKMRGKNTPSVSQKLIAMSVILFPIVRHPLNVMMIAVITLVRLKARYIIKHPLTGQRDLIPENHRTYPGRCFLRPSHWGIPMNHSIMIMIMIMNHAYHGRSTTVIIIVLVVLQLATGITSMIAIDITSMIAIDITSMIVIDTTPMIAIDITSMIVIDTTSVIVIDILMIAISITSTIVTNIIVGLGSIRPHPVGYGKMTLIPVI